MPLMHLAHFKTRRERSCPPTHLLYLTYDIHIPGGTRRRHTHLRTCRSLAHEPTVARPVAKKLRHPASWHKDTASVRYLPEHAPSCRRCSADDYGCRLGAISRTRVNLTEAKVRVEAASGVFHYSFWDITEDARGILRPPDASDA